MKKPRYLRKKVSSFDLTEYSNVPAAFIRHPFASETGIGKVIEVCGKKLFFWMHNQYGWPLITTQKYINVSSGKDLNVYVFDLFLYGEGNNYEFEASC
jgi:hypothetical protein